MYTVDCIQSAKTIQKEEWNSLASSTYESHGWHTLTEDSNIITSKPRHILVRKNGKLVAIATTYIQTDELFANLEEFLLGGKKKLLPFTLNPCLLCYSPLNMTEKGVLITPELSFEEQKKVFKLIISKMETIVKEEQLDTYGFLNFADDDLPLANVLKEHAHMDSFIGYLTEKKITTNVFDDFLYTLKKKKRKQIRKDFRENERYGVVIEKYTDLTPFIDTILDFLNQNFEKHNKNSRFKFTKEFFEKMNEHLRGNILLLVAKKKGKVVGTSLDFMFKERFDSFKVGHDYSSIKEDYNSFALIIDEPLRQAVINGMKHVSFGTGSYTYKIQRGLNLSNRYMFLKSTSPIKQLFLKLLLSYTSRKKRKQHQESIIYEKQQEEIPA